MLNLSINQLLHVWGELVRAHDGQNTFGGNMAEIYAWMLMPCSPMAERGNEKAMAQRKARAWQSLRAMLEKFAEDFGCEVRVNEVRMNARNKKDPFFGADKVLVRIINLHTVNEK